MARYEATAIHRSGGVRSRRRAVFTGLLGMLLAIVLLPLGGYLYAWMQPAAYAQSATAVNPRAAFWREVRSGTAGTTRQSGRELDGSVANPAGGVLIQNGGQNWRELRNGPVSTYGAYLMGVALALIVLVYLVRGTVRIEGGRSGRRVLRWAAWERAMHWYTAILFIVMAVTGLSLLFGRLVLIPLLGLRGFAVWADVSKTLHNYLGPAFTFGVLIMVVSWIAHNLPARGDLRWWRSFGGMFGKSHARAGRMNAGEKAWFWFITLVGGAVCVAGLILDFPEYGQSRELMQTANLVHSALAMLWVAAFFGHVYIGTLGTEGALEGMTTGYVDERWAKQHHEAWYEEIGDRPVGEVRTAPGVADQPG